MVPATGAVDVPATQPNEGPSQCSVISGGARRMRRYPIPRASRSLRGGAEVGGAAEAHGTFALTRCKSTRASFAAGATPDASALFEAQHQHVMARHLGIESVLGGAEALFRPQVANGV